MSATTTITHERHLFHSLCPQVRIVLHDDGHEIARVGVNVMSGKFHAQANTWSAIERLPGMYYLAMEERAVWLAELSAASPPLTPTRED